MFTAAASFGTAQIYPKSAPPPIVGTNQGAKNECNIGNTQQGIQRYSRKHVLEILGQPHVPINIHVQRPTFNVY
jgi:hypothetical protein